MERTRRNGIVRLVLTFTTGDILLNLYRRAGYEGRQNAGGKKQILFQLFFLFKVDGYFLAVKGKYFIGGECLVVETEFIQ